MPEPAAAKVQFSLEEFQGPLDLLLFLLKKNEINIYDIPIAQITEQFLEYLALSTSLNLESVTEFYQMAAQLLYIKSRTLLPLPASDDDAWEDPRRELVEKLLEHQKYKRLAELLAENEAPLDWIYERKKPQPALPFAQGDEAWAKIEVWDLFQTFSKIMKGLSSERVLNLMEEVSIHEKITLVREILTEKESCLFTDLILNPQSVLEVVCAFLAILELVKAQTIVLYQSLLFGDIQIRRHSGGF
ncbi:MAG: segregation/condensation protein A [Spirochaetales bacterium]|nr:segregation/condensation protein A [Spirochaetales bacterium]